ncbi:MAG TPA: hypothetical protein VF081_09265 [Solirubrobacterales bacterium]
MGISSNIDEGAPNTDSVASLPDIDDVAPVGAADEACLAEIREILRQHGKLDRFGVMLLHQHFDLDDSEILVEDVDVDERTMVIRPVKRDQLVDVPSVGTQWRLDSDTVLQGCMQRCTKSGPLGIRHKRSHF